MIKHRIIYIVLLLAGIFTSCLKDSVPGNDPSHQRTRIRFTLKVPGATRALDPATHEIEVRDVTVFVFEPLGGDFIEAVPGENIAADYSSFEVELAAGNFDLVLLANCKAHINTLYPSGIATGMTRAALETALTVELAGKWNAVPSHASYIPIPMFAQKTNITIADQTSLTGDPFQLVRMVAKINVTLSAAAAANLQLDAIHVYHRNTKGTMIPLSANMGSATGSDGMSYPIVTAPSIPTGTNVNQKTGVTYKRSDGEIAADGSCTDEIYVLEAAAGGKSIHPAYFCLILEGTFIPSGKKAYYRLDLKNTQKGNLPILRNHNYEVLIKSFNSSGQQSEDDAYNSVTADIEMEVVPWDASALDVSPSEQRLLYSSNNKGDVTELQGLRIWIWSNQQDVRIEELTGAGEDVDDMFYNLVGTNPSNFEYNYNTSTRTGFGYFDIVTDTAKPLVNAGMNKAVELRLNAGGLVRILNINIVTSP